MRLAPVAAYIPTASERLRIPHIRPITGRCGFSSGSRKNSLPAILGVTSVEMPSAVRAPRRARPVGVEGSGIPFSLPEVASVSGYAHGVPMRSSQISAGGCGGSPQSGCGACTCSRWRLRTTSQAIHQSFWVQAEPLEELLVALKVDRVGQVTEHLADELIRVPRTVENSRGFLVSSGRRVGAHAMSIRSRSQAGVSRSSSSARGAEECWVGSCRP